MRQLNDQLCREWRLSVIENPKPKSRQAGERAAIQYGVSGKERLRQTIDRLLPDSRDFEDFLARMRSEGFEVKLGKQIAFRPPGQAYFVKTHRLGDAYTKAALMERTRQPARAVYTSKTARLTTGRRVNCSLTFRRRYRPEKARAMSGGRGFLIFRRLLRP